MCLDALSALALERNQCPIEVYFTIDTSETIALQEPPPGSLVESIKVTLIYLQVLLVEPEHKIVTVYPASE